MQILTEDAHNKTGLSLSYADGKMVYAKDKDGNPLIAVDESGNPIGSAEARNLLMGAINASETAKFQFYDVSGSHADLGGLRFGLNISQIEAFVAGTSPLLNPTTMGWGINFLHELSHTKIGGSLSDGSMAWGVPGPAEDRMNLIRSQMGSDYGQRMSYAARLIGGTSYLPMGPASFNILDGGSTTSAYVVQFVKTWR